MSENKKNVTANANQENNNTENANPAPANGTQDQADGNKKGDTEVKKENWFMRIFHGAGRWLDKHPVFAGFLGAASGGAAVFGATTVGYNAYLKVKRSKYHSMPLKQEPIDTTYKTVKVVVPSVPETNMIEPASAPVGELTEQQAVQNLVNTLADTPVSNEEMINF